MSRAKSKEELKAWIKTKLEEHGYTRKEHVRSYVRGVMQVVNRNNTRYKIDYGKQKRRRN